MQLTIKKSQSLQTATDEFQHVELVANGEPNQEGIFINTTHYTVNLIVNGIVDSFTVLTDLNEAHLMYEDSFTDIIEGATAHMEKRRQELSDKLLG